MTAKRKVAIIGAGLAGASAALGFAKAGFDVTLYSDKDRPTLRDRLPMTGNAVYFGEALDYDAEIIEDLYYPRGDIARLNSRLYGPLDTEQRPVLEIDRAPAFRSQGVDVRLRADDRLQRFVDIGGELRIRDVSLDDLDAIAGEADLTLVATGKRQLSSIFPVDERRTVYHQPQRHLLLVTLKDVEGSAAFSYRSSEGRKTAFYNFDKTAGEVFLGPYEHKDVGASWSFLGFARTDGPWARRFAAVSDLQSARDTVVELFATWFPEDAEEIAKLQPIWQDPYSWLSGAVTPTVRQPVARTAGGHLVAALGDAAIAFDPIAGQGAQGASVQIALLLRAARQHAGAFGEQWLTEQFDHYWHERAWGATELTRLSLGDPKYRVHSELLFPAAAVSPGVARALTNLTSQPKTLLGVQSREEVLAFISASAGEPAEAVLARFKPVAGFSAAGGPTRQTG